MRVALVAILAVVIAFADSSPANIANQTARACDPTLTTVSGRFAPGGQLCKNQLIFDEQFNNLNLNLWGHEVKLKSDNGEFQWYVNDRRNSFVENGVLHIRPTLTTDVIPDLTNCHIKEGNVDFYCNGNNIAPPVRSARMTTYNGFNFKYGRTEIRAKTPTGDWLWPATWMMPHASAYGGWPRSGEIDLMESRGNANLYNGNGEKAGAEEFGSTLHFGTESYNSAYRTSNFHRRTAPGQGWNKGFHSYKMEWAPTHISFTVDNTYMGVIPTGDGYFRRGGFSGYNPWGNGGLDAPFDKEFYFILNLAIGATNGYFSNDGNQGGKPWQNNAQYPQRDFWNGRNQWLSTWNLNQNNAYEASLLVDYVKVWAL